MGLDKTPKVLPLWVLSYLSLLNKYKALRNSGVDICDNVTLKVVFMDEYGIFQGEDLIFTIGGKERAEEMVKRYPGATIAPVIEKNRKWVKKPTTSG